MIINLWLLFICLNVAFGLVHVPGSPLSVYQSTPGNNCFYPPGFEADPVAQSPIGANDSIDSMEDLEQEMAFPTNSTNSQVIHLIPGEFPLNPTQPIH